MFVVYFPNSSISDLFDRGFIIYFHFLVTQELLTSCNVIVGIEKLSVQYLLSFCELNMLPMAVLSEKYPTMITHVIKNDLICISHPNCIQVLSYHENSETRSIYACAGKKKQVMHIFQNFQSGVVIERQLRECHSNSHNTYFESQLKFSNNPDL